MQKLFQELVWPAAAGNVAWAFFTVLVKEEFGDPGVVARLCALLVLAVYLGTDWLRTHAELTRLKSWYWVGDAFHLTAIVIFAISTQEKSSSLTLPLAAVFGVTIFGHLLGAWEPKGAIKRRLARRSAMALVNASGLGLLCFLPQLLPADSLWHLSISMAVVVVIWIAVRKPIYAQV